MNTTYPNRHHMDAIIVGTPETARQAVAQLRLLTGRLYVVGCVLVDATGAYGIGVPVLGVASELGDLTKRVRFDTAIVSLPSAMSGVIREIRATLARLGIAERFMPPVTELLARTPPFVVGAAGSCASLSVEANAIDPVALIGREPRPIDSNLIDGLIRGKRVLITGAGGSIGSEIARLCAARSPASLALMERAENALFDISRRVESRHPGVERCAILHDVVDAPGTRRWLDQYRPHVVFHAAAHKHVPLMEDHPALAVDNNVFGTKAIADAALACGAERFVLISSDKAVNPSSVMGATKRLAELYVQGLHARAHRTGTPGATRFSIVRFGNVLGSACSVLQIWGSQLAEGGPITLTDPRMTRYFMTIPEAAALVAQAAALEPARPESASVYVLDMGDPVAILDLANRFVSAHGFEPRMQGELKFAAGGPTVEIRCTGIRPGEKIHEELAHGADELTPTPAAGVQKWTGDQDRHTDIAAMIADLATVRRSNDRASVVEAIWRHLDRREPLRIAA